MNPHAYDEPPEEVAMPPYLLGTRDGDASTSSTSKTKLGKRATAHPPAISETRLITSDSNNELSEKGGVGMINPLAMGAITLSLCSAVFMVSLDQTIIATAAPQITDEFGSLADVGWYGSAYLLATASFQLPYGRLYSIYSVKWIFISAVVIFEIGSVICAAANSSAVLIFGRAVAGIGGTGIFSGSLIIAAHCVPLQYRPVYTGAIGALSGIAAIAGPPLGGALTDRASWRWCFWINLPFGALTAATVLFLTPAMAPQPEGGAIVGTQGALQRLARLDFLGMAAIIPAIVCCLLALQWGGTVYAWDSARIVGLYIASFVLLCCFVGIQLWKKDNATLPPRIMKNRNIIGAVWFSFTLGAAFFIVVYYLPLWFQAIKGASASQSGAMNLAMVLAVVITSLLAGGMITALGYYTPFMIACSAITAAGCGLLTALRPDSPPTQWIGYQVVLGVGVGLGMQQPLMAVQTVLDLADVPTGTSVIVFAQTIGSSILLIVAQNLFTNKLLAGLARQVPSVSPAAVLGAGALGVLQGVPEAVKPGVLWAYNGAVTTAMYLPTATAAVSIIGALAMEWKSVKGRRFDRTGEGAS